MKCTSCKQPTTFVCTACDNVGYCSVLCQKKDWKNHKQVCNFIQGKTKRSEEIENEQSKKQKGDLVLCAPEGKVEYIVRYRYIDSEVWITSFFRHTLETAIQATHGDVLWEKKGDRRYQIQIAKVIGTKNNEMLVLETWLAKDFFQ